MSIQSMRTWIKTHRVWIFVLFAILVIGLLASYSIGGLSGLNQTDQTGEPTVEDYAAVVEQSRTAYEANPTGYTEAKSLADNLYEYARALMNSGDYALAAEVSLEASDLYEVVLTNAPADLNAAGVADLWKTRINYKYSQAVAMLYTQDEEAAFDLLRDCAALTDEAIAAGQDTFSADDLAELVSYKARCFYVIGENETAEGFYQEALEISPTAATVVYAYVEFLAGNSRFEDAKAELEELRAALPADSQNLATIDAYLTEINSYIDAANSTPVDDGTADGADADGTADGDAADTDAQ